MAEHVFPEALHKRLEQFLLHGRDRRKGTPVDQKVIVTDEEMPFNSMVAFMIKWALASIPAALTLMLLGAIVVGLFSVLVR